MESMKKIGRPKTGKSPIVNFRSRTKLSGREVKILVEDGKVLFKELKRIALQTRDEKVIEILRKNSRLREVLNKWEEDEA